MDGWDIKRSDLWAHLLGMVVVPMFNPYDARRPQGVHSLMLDGTKGSFVLSSDIPTSDPNLVRWAWSANVRRSVAIDAAQKQAIVRCWDSPDELTRWPILGEQDVIRLSKSFDQSYQPPPKGLSVIDRGLKTFIDIRKAMETEGGVGLDVVLAFNTILAWVADSDEDRQIEFGDAIRAMISTGGISFTTEQVSPQLLSYPLGDLARLLREGDSAASRYLLDANLLIRHASGPLYQEAHKQLLESPESDVQKELFQSLIPGRERLHAPAPSFVHHTPPLLARALVEIALRFVEVDHSDGSLDILDPACGSGVFLIESARETGIHPNLPQTVHLSGFDSSNLAVAMADFCVRNANPTRGEQTVTIQKRNSLSVDDWGAPHIIAMNPPFVAWQHLSNEDRQLVRRTLGSLHKGRPDLSFAFIVRALSSLRPGGVMASLMPSSFLDSESAQAIRGYISRSNEFQVRLIGHFRDFNYFDATVEPSFIVVSRSGRETPVQIVTAQSGFVEEAIRTLRRGEPLSRVGYELHSVGRGELAADWWTLQPQRNLKFIEALKSQTLLTVADFFVPRLGIRPGNKPVFTAAENELGQLCSTAAERRFFRPIADRIEAGVIQPSGYIFYPYDTKGVLLLGTEEELKKSVPQFYKIRLQPAERRLKSRKSLYRKWWEVSEPVATWLALRTPRIISQAFGSAGNFAFDSHGAYAVVQGVGWCWKHGNPTEEIMLAYLGLLNSTIFDQVLSCFCPRVRGGQFNLSSRFIKRVPLPRFANDDLRRSLSEIGRAITNGRRYDLKRQYDLILQAYALSPEAAGPIPLDVRIGELAELREGWFEPGSPRLDPGPLASFRIFMERVLSHGSIPVPYVYPTPEGNVQAEWSFPSWEVSATASLASGTLHLHATHLDSDFSREAETRLMGTDATDTLLEFVTEFLG